MRVRNIIAALEVLLLCLFLVPFPVVNVGNAAGIAVAAVLLVITLRWKPFVGALSKAWSCAVGKVLVIAVGAVTVALTAAAGVLSVNMYRAMKNTPDKPDILIVLGCKVKGERPTRMLRRRLDAAYDYMIKNPQVKCIVSGGQGSDEIISEAEAMERYLIEKGISPDRIIKEDRSASTDENLKNSFEITDKLGMPRNITIVTDGFHQYRAKLIAEKYGAQQVHAVSAQTEPRYLPTYWVREWFGLAHLWIFGS